jgi:hypothetical protein
MRAKEPQRPSQTTNVVLAGVVVAEPLVRGLERERVINSSNRVSSRFGPSSVQRGSGSVKGIPIFGKSSGRSGLHTT